MISGETLTVSLEEAIENHLLRSGNPAATSGGEDYWATVEKHVAAEDYTPLLGLVAELRDKIIGLTPRRRDLAAETSEAMDVELLEQMMDYGAFDVVRATACTARSIRHPPPPVVFVHYGSTSTSTTTLPIDVSGAVLLFVSLPRVRSYAPVTTAAWSVMATVEREQALGFGVGMDLTINAQINVSFHEPTVTPLVPADP